MVASAPFDGAETSTREAPFSRWMRALSAAEKMPVHSITTSTSDQGSSAGLRIAVARIRPRPTSIQSAPDVTSTGRRPCTLSKRIRWALVSTGPRSLIATISISSRPCSIRARRTRRPIRPNPLMATLVVMRCLSFRRIGRDIERYVGANNSIFAPGSSQFCCAASRGAAPGAECRRCSSLDFSPFGADPQIRIRHEKTRHAGRTGLACSIAPRGVRSDGPWRRQHRPCATKTPIRCHTRPAHALCGRQPWSVRGRRSTNAWCG